MRISLKVPPGKDVNEAYQAWLSTFFDQGGTWVQTDRGELCIHNPMLRPPATEGAYVVERRGTVREIAARTAACLLASYEPNDPTEWRIGPARQEEETATATNPG